MPQGNNKYKNAKLVLDTFLILWYHHVASITEVKEVGVETKLSSKTWDRLKSAAVVAYPEELTDVLKSALAVVAGASGGAMRLAEGTTTSFQVHTDGGIFSISVSEVHFKKPS